MKYIIMIMLSLFAASGCKKYNDNNSTISNTIQNNSYNKKRIEIIQRFEYSPKYISTGFDFPVGKPDCKGYYNAQKFQENKHLGDDWNGLGGGDSDLGDPIYAIANGYISEVKDYSGGWGNVIRIIHLHRDKLYESVYAHCDTILKKQNSFVMKGDKIALIGNCNGAYPAHLHLEIRDSIKMEIGPGYSENTNGYLDPSEFINENRK